MKSLLLLLASGLVTSDKLDRTYLPPPGATYSGGTFDDLRLPLEFPKEAYMGAFQTPAGFDKTKTFTGFSTNQDSEKVIPVGNSAFTFQNNVSPVTQFLNSGYQTTVPTSTPVESFYDSFPSKSPSIGYLPSKQSTVGTESDFNAKPRPDFDGIVTTSSLLPNINKKDRNNYYLPNMQLYRNGIIKQGSDSYRFPKVEFGTKPNRINTNDANQKYQPSFFGYYGGTPMIMTTQNVLPQELEGMDFSSKYEAEVKNDPSFKQDNNMSEGPPPVMQLDSKDVAKPFDSRTSTSISSAIPSTFSSDPTTFFNKNLHLLHEQRNKIPERTGFTRQRPQMESERNAVIVNYENNISPDGYSYRYDTSNGIHADESGIATNGVRAKGSYSFTGDDGKIYSVTYTADENGFQPRGDHLPTAPPIPEAIQRVIDQAAKDKAAGIIDDGSYDERKYGHLNYQGAMDHYRPFKVNGDKTSKSSDRRKPSQFHQNKNKSKFDNISLYNGDGPVGSPDIFPAVMEKHANINDIDPKRNKLKDETELNTENRLNNGKNNQNRRPITYLNDEKIIPIDKVKMMPDAKMKTKYETTNTSNFNKKDQIIQKEIPYTSSRSTFTTNGYFYVPPVTKFNTNPTKSTIEQNLNFTTGKTIPITIDTDTNKRARFNDSQTIINMGKEDSSTQIPFIANTVATEPTRKPYISGPDDHNKQMYENLQSNVFSKTNTNLPISYTTNPDFMYSLNTTPMTTDTVQESQNIQNPDQNSQYYPSTTSPSMFDQTFPSNVENRLNIPSVNPGITVSQDLVTTTYRPSISGDGVLEINQNVKIHGIGSPDTTTAFNGYPERIPDNNSFYSATTLNGEPIGDGENLNSFYPGPVQDTAVFLGNPTENSPYGNGYSYRVPNADFDRTSGPYYNTGFDRIPQGDPSVVPNTSIFNTSTFGNSEKNPVQETTPIRSNQNPELDDKITGEDFTGPRQPQAFDAETGYYYK